MLPHRKTAATAYPTFRVLPGEPAGARNIPTARKPALH